MPEQAKFDGPGRAQPVTSSLHPELLALHGLAVRKLATAATVAADTGLEPGRARAALAAAADAGYVTEARGSALLSPAGRVWLQAQYPSACAQMRSSDAFAAAYEAFESINREALELFTRWQTVPAGGDDVVANDHADENYDNRIIDELGDVHERVTAVLERFAAVDGRFSIYSDRLEAAYDRALGGDIDWVSGARIDSYHTVWFGLHEDILRVLGRVRREQ